MKNMIFSALASILVLVSCQQQKAGFTLNGTLEGSAEKTIVVSVIDKDGLSTLDTLSITEGVVNYTTTLDEPMMMMVSEAGKRNSVTLFGENVAYTINGNAENLGEAVITGGSLFDVYKKVSDAESALGKMSGELRPKYAAANQAGDTAKAKSIYDEYLAEQKKVDGLKEEVLNTNLNTAVGAYITYNTFRHKNLDEMKEGLAKLDASLSQASYVVALQERITKLESVAVGKQAPDFTQDDTEGNPVSLSSLKGKYLLIDFWASWCGPCRAENPNVVKLYAEYKDKGFDILGVSLDQKKDAWLKAIEDDQLTWNHVSDLKGWKNAASTLYGVSGIPHTVLLDKEGVIIAKNLRGEALKAKLAELMD